MLANARGVGHDISQPVPLVAIEVTLVPHMLQLIGYLLPFVLQILQLSDILLLYCLLLPTMSR